MKYFFRIPVIFISLFAATNLLISNQDSITIIFGGDCTFTKNFDAVIKDDFNKPFGSIPWFSKADISMVNLENCISLRGSKVAKKFNFRMHPKYLEVMKNAGIDIVNVANNHIVDYGSTAFEDTFFYLDSIGIKYAGAGKNLQESRKPAIIKVNGKKFGFLGYYSGNAAGENKFGTPPRNSKYIKEDIRKLKEELKVDYVIVNFHWGIEGKNNTNPEQRQIGRSTIDAGADLVIGHHPHVLQGVEHYKGRFIVYSLGNFIFGGNSRREHYTMVFKLTIKNGEFIPEIIPIHVSNFCAYNVEGLKKDSLLQMIEGFSKDLERLE